MTTPGLKLLLLAALLAPEAALAQTLPAQQITSSVDGINQFWFNRTSVTSGGKILFPDSNQTVHLYDGVAVQQVQATTGFPVDSVVSLGSGATPGTVTAAWRRNANLGYVSVNGGTPQTVNLNPEHANVDSGCVFMALQTAANGNQAFSIDPATGNKTQISADPATANKGAFRIFNTGCNKAVWSWQPSTAVDIQYWNGTTATTLVSDVQDLIYSFAAGKLVYTKVVAGVQQVFVIDTNVSLTPVQLSNETDAAKLLTRPQTDGRHVAWYRSNADGSAASIVLNGGISFPTGPLGAIDSFGFPFQLNRGQMLWASAAPGSPRSFLYFDGTQTFTIDPSPATDIVKPWLTDGYIAFLGPTPTSGTDNEVFRVTGTTPADSAQPSPPLLVTATPAAGQVTVDWDRILGATSYNLYVATVPGVTKDNYASLAGGQRITGVTPPYIPSLPTNQSYYFAVSTVDATGEGPTSRVASATLVGSLTWQSVGGLSATQFYSVAADPANWLLTHAGANGSIYRSTNGGIDWTQVLSSATTGANRIAALAVTGSQVFANAMTQADIWLSSNSGASWGATPILDATGFGEPWGSLAIDPANSNVMYAGDFEVPGWDPSSSSLVVKSTNGGGVWSLTPQAPGLADELHAYAIAIDPNNPSTLYAGGSGTPNIAKSTDGAASWIDIPIPGNTGGVYSIAVDPANSNTVYATTRDLGVYKSVDGGTTWTAKNTGLAGVSVSSGTGFNSILIDPENENYLHLGAGNGYWYSIDGGETWTAANNGFGGTAPYINALALTPARRLLAATDSGLWMLGVGPAPVVTTVSPNLDNIAGGTMITITGSGFQPAAAVAFGGTAATNVNVVTATTITATDPAHAAGAVDVVVTNFDGQSGTLAGGFTYTATPLPPTGVTATAQSTTSVLVTWNASATATSYKVFRRDNSSGTFTEIPGSPLVGTSISDTVGPATAHLYRVQAVNGAGASGNSATDIATTVIFTDGDLTGGVTVKAVHLQQLRDAVTAVRNLAGSGATTFTDTASPGLIIKAIHITELRTQLDAALPSLGIPAGGYTDSSPGGLAIKAIHFQELRNRMK